MNVNCEDPIEILYNLILYFSLHLVNSFVLALLTVGVLACVNPPSPEGGGEGVPGSTGGEPGGGAAVAGQDGNAAPEFKAVRGAIQPITEINAALGKKLEASCEKAEGAIAASASSMADKHLVEMLKALSGSDTAPDIASDLYAALATDLEAVKAREGAPKLKVTQTKDKCCGASGACDQASPGATCYSATLEGNSPSCACRTGEGGGGGSGSGVESGSTEGASEAGGLPAGSGASSTSGSASSSDAGGSGSESGVSGSAEISPSAKGSGKGKGGAELKLGGSADTKSPGSKKSSGKKKKKKK